MLKHSLSQGADSAEATSRRPPSSPVLQVEELVSERGALQAEAAEQRSSVGRLEAAAAADGAVLAGLRTRLQVVEAK